MESSRDPLRAVKASSLESGDQVAGPCTRSPPVSITTGGPPCVECTCNCGRPTARARYRQDIQSPSGEIDGLSSNPGCEASGRTVMREKSIWLRVWRNSGAKTTGGGYKQ